MSHAGAPYQTFYMDNMEEDSWRVERLFRDANKMGICIQVTPFLTCTRRSLVVGPSKSMYDSDSESDPTHRGGRSRWRKFDGMCCRGNILLSFSSTRGRRGNFVMRLKLLHRCEVGETHPPPCSQINRPWGSGADLYCCGSGEGYTGHYILLCGYNSDRGDFIVQDPASIRQTLHIPGGLLEDARKCFGTDEDLLIVPRRRLSSTQPGEDLMMERSS